MTTINGKWSFFWKYEGVPHYETYPVPVSFQNDGIWRVGNQEVGMWCEQNGMINLDFNNNNILEFSGMRQGGAMVGIFNWNGYPTSHGVWYMVRISDTEMKIVEISEIENGFPTPEDIK